MDEFVLAGASASRRDQPMEFKESRKDEEAMFAFDLDVFVGSRVFRTHKSRAFEDAEAEGDV